MASDNTNFNLFLLILSVLPAVLFAITTIHHDKPESARISKMVVRQMRTPNITNPVIERQKRLLPYYHRLTNINSNNINNYRPPNKPHYVEFNPKFTPFLDSNALPGRFVPIVKTNQPDEYLYEKPPGPDYPAIYDKLAALKQKNEQQLRKPQFNYVRLQNAPETVIETYQPTHIDIQQQQHVDETPYRTPQTPRPIIIYGTTAAPSEHPKAVNAIIDDKYEAQKFVYEHDAEQSVYIQPKYYAKPLQIPVTENPNTLSVILKQLQDSNALPHTLTPDNIDNSIKTLVKILNSLKKKQQNFNANPIVVDEEVQQQQQQEPEPPVVVVEKPEFVPGTITQSFPANTIDGGTPGRPGVDYPALSSIPQTSFNCKNQRYKGFFGDPHTNCQVWHYCDLNGGQASFLCPNGTIFSQVALTCDWWYNVKCASTPQLYVLNERLYKYILPLSPKFPEDYSGPLVDKYIALKFQEMEEKMNKEREKEDASEEEEEEKDDSDQLQDINNSRNNNDEKK